jgi:curved DNA-binding protein CbpA
MKYFTVDTVAEIKKAYRKLCSLHHPDKGGRVETMQDINAQYHAKLKSVHGTTSVDEVGNDHIYRYDEDLEQGLIDKIDELIKSGLTSSLDAVLIGTWLWVSGDTKPHKEGLKTLKFRWHSKRGLWYWHEGKYRSRQSRLGIDSIAAQYGASKIMNTQRRIK